jgi:non-reducing end alpha-L-arabinofuranosidase
MMYSSILNLFKRALTVIVICISIAPFNSFASDCPCDIYKNAGTPCVAAYSTVRRLSSTYDGPLYQVRKTTDKTTKDIFLIAGGTVADAAAQDSFLGTGAGTISKLYDQSGKGNDLIKGPAGNYSGTASQPDNEANAKGKSFMINGHKAYAIYINPVEGYRNNQSTGMPTGNAAQGIYAVEDGSRANVGDKCCFDFGNASKDNTAGSTGSMNSLFFGVCTYWEKGSGSGPWFMNDMEAGVRAGGATNSKLPSSKFDFAFGITKTNTGGSPQWALRVADGTVGNGALPKLVTAVDGQAPSTWKMPGGIILGVGGDNSNSSNGTFYEGCITAGRPSDETDDAILKNVAAARYGATTPTAVYYGAKDAAPAPGFKVRYNPSSAGAVICYALKDARRVSMNIYDQQGRRVSAIVDGIIPAGRHEAAWDTKRVPPGIYMCRTAIDGLEGLSGKIIIGK